MHGPLQPSRDRDRAAHKRERRRLAKQRYRALLEAGGKVLTLHIRDRNALTEALLNTGWIAENENSENWELTADRVATMINGFAETHRDAPLSPMDRPTAKAVPSSKA